MPTGVGKNQQGLPEDAPRAWRRWSRRGQDIAAILWSSFIAAGIGSAVFFGNVDPQELDAITTPDIDFPILAGYAIGFFFFWAVSAISGLLAVFMIRTSRRQDGRSRGHHH